MSFLGCFKKTYVIIVPGSNDLLQYVSISQRKNKICSTIHKTIWRAKKEILEGNNYNVSLNSCTNVYN